MARKRLRRATEQNGLEALGAMRRLIRKGGTFAENATLTREIKGSAKPLVDNATSLFQALTSKVTSDTSVFIGMLKRDEFFDIAEALHDGRVIPVTPKMRQMFQALHWASIGNLDPAELTGRAAELWKRKQTGWFPLKPSTTAIVLPPRPFVDAVFDGTSLSGLKVKVRRNWERAINDVLREVARKK